MLAEQETSDRFRLGINYWPARVAMRWWHDFDAVELRADLDRISAAGFDSIRIFLTWEAFQPTPREVSSAMLERLILTSDIAGEAGLDVMPTLFTGHMSGVNWIPSWALGGADTAPRFRVMSQGSIRQRLIRNWFTDTTIVDAQILMASAAASALADHPAIWAWDLGNENSNCSIPPDPAAGREWLLQITSAIRAADPSSAITIGTHMEDLEENRNLGPADAAVACDFLTMHGYPIYAPWARGATDEFLLSFLTEVTRWLGGGSDVVFTEFGLPTIPRGDGPIAEPSSMLVDEAVAAAYIDRALGVIRDAGARGAMLWCYSDYDPAIWSAPPLDDATHERSFGLWRADGSAKPAVATVGAHHGLECKPVADPPMWIDIAPDEFYTDEGSHLPRLYRSYCADIAARPTD